MLPGPSLLDVLRSAQRAQRAGGRTVAKPFGAACRSCKPPRIAARRPHIVGDSFAWTGRRPGSGIQPDLLLRPLTAWEPLEAKVDAIDFSFLPSDTGTWAGSATRIQGAADQRAPWQLRALVELARLRVAWGAADQAGVDGSIHADRGVDARRKRRIAACFGR